MGRGRSPSLPAWTVLRGTSLTPSPGSAGPMLTMAVTGQSPSSMSSSRPPNHPRPMSSILPSPLKRRRPDHPSPRKKAKLAPSPAQESPEPPLRRAARPIPQKNAKAGPSTLAPRPSTSILATQTPRRALKRRAPSTSDSYSTDAAPPPPTLSELLAKKKNSKAQPSPRKKPKLVSLDTIEISSCSEDDAPLRAKPHLRKRLIIAADADVIDLCSESEATPPPQSSPTRTRIENGVISILTTDDEVDAHQNEEPHVESPTPFSPPVDEVFLPDACQPPYFRIGSLLAATAPASSPAIPTAPEPTPLLEESPEHSVSAETPAVPIEQERESEGEDAPVMEIVVSPEYDTPAMEIVPPVVPIEQEPEDKEDTPLMEIVVPAKQKPEPRVEDAPVEVQLSPSEAQGKEVPLTLPRRQSLSKSRSNTADDPPCHATNSPLPTSTRSSPSFPIPGSPCDSLATYILSPPPSSSLPVPNFQPPQSSCRSTLTLSLSRALFPFSRARAPLETGLCQPPSLKGGGKGKGKGKGTYMPTYSAHPVVPVLNSGSWYARMRRGEAGVAGKGKEKEAVWDGKGKGKGREVGYVAKGKGKEKAVVAVAENAGAAGKESAGTARKESAGAAVENTGAAVNVNVSEERSKIKASASARGDGDMHMHMSPMEDDDLPASASEAEVNTDTNAALEKEDKSRSQFCGPQPEFAPKPVFVADMDMGVEEEEEESHPQGLESASEPGFNPDMDVVIEEEEESSPEVPESDADPVNADTGMATDEKERLVQVPDAVVPEHPLAAHAEDSVSSSSLLAAVHPAATSTQAQDPQTVESDTNSIPEHVIAESKLLVSFLTGLRRLKNPASIAPERTELFNGIFSALQRATPASSVEEPETDDDLEDQLVSSELPSSRESSSETQSKPRTTQSPHYGPSIATTEPPTITLSPEPSEEHEHPEAPAPISQHCPPGHTELSNYSSSTSHLRAFSTHSSRNSPPSDSPSRKASDPLSCLETSGTSDDSPGPLTPPLSGRMKTELLMEPLIRRSATSEVLVDFVALEKQYLMSDDDDDDDDSDSVADLDFVYPEELAS